MLTVIIILLAVLALATLVPKLLVGAALTLWVCFLVALIPAVFVGGYLLFDYAAPGTGWLFVAAAAVAMFSST